MFSSVCGGTRRFLKSTDRGGEKPLLDALVKHSTNNAPLVQPQCLKRFVSGMAVFVSSYAGQVDQRRLHRFAAVQVWKSCSRQRTLTSRPRLIFSVTTFQLERRAYVGQCTALAESSFWVKPAPADGVVSVFSATNQSTSILVRDLSGDLACEHRPQVATTPRCRLKPFKPEPQPTYQQIVVTQTEYRKPWPGSARWRVVSVSTVAQYRRKS